MAKNLRFRDHFLLSLAFLGDEFLNFTQPYPLQAKRWAGLLPPDYKKSNLKRNIYRLLKTEEIEKIVNFRLLKLSIWTLT